MKPRLGSFSPFFEKHNKKSNSVQLLLTCLLELLAGWPCFCLAGWVADSTFSLIVSLAIKDVVLMASEFIVGLLEWAL